MPGVQVSRRIGKNEILDVLLVVDANQGWDFELLKEVIPKCVGLDLGMIEQPLPRDRDDSLEGFESPIILAADESCLHTVELEAAARRYDMINIKTKQVA